MLRWVWILVCWYWLTPLGAHATPQLLTQVQATVVVQEQRTQRALELPYAWDKENSGQQGEAVFDMAFSAEGRTGEPWGLFVQRAGNAYEIWLNGVLLQREGDLVHYNEGDFALIPRYVTIPPELVWSSNQLRVHIRADAGRKGGLAPLLVGLLSEVRPVYQRTYLTRVVFTLLISLFSLVVGVLALAMWLIHPVFSTAKMPHRDPVYLYASIAELCWSFGVGYMFFDEPPLPWPWWGVFPVTAGAAWICAMMLFCAEVSGWAVRPAYRWLKGWLFFLACMAPVAVLSALSMRKPMILTVCYGLTGITNLSFAVFFLKESLGRSTRTQKLMAAAVLTNVLVGLRDLYVYRLDPSYTSITWLRYSSMLFGLTLLYIVMARYRRATHQVHESSMLLTSRVVQKEQELNASYVRLETLARAQERTEERSRILRDMHDGVGAHLSVAMRQLQSDDVSRSDVLDTLRESMDRLKLSIDSINLPAGDITALLANMRYRLEPRLEASGIALQWNVDHIPGMPHLDNRALVHLQFMVYEALSNVLQHAHARTLRIEAKSLGSGISLKLVDDGTGFDTAAPLRKGLLSMRDRAHAIGADLHFRSEPGLTEVEIVIH